MKSRFQDNVIEKYSTHNERKSGVAERFIRASKTKFTNIWVQYQKNVYIHISDDMVNE